MRRFIAVTASVLGATCAIALANNNSLDASSNNNDMNSAVNAEQSAQHRSDQALGSQPSVTDTNETCTDNEGRIFRRNNSGFSACMSENRAESRGEMGGTAVDNDSPTTSDTVPRYDTGSIDDDDSLPDHDASESNLGERTGS